MIHPSVFFFAPTVKRLSLARLIFVPEIVQRDLVTSGRECLYRFVSVILERVLLQWSKELRDFARPSMEIFCMELVKGSSDLGRPFVWSCQKTSEIFQRRASTKSSGRDAGAVIWRSFGSRKELSYNDLTQRPLCDLASRDSPYSRSYTEIL